MLVGSIRPSCTCCTRSVPSRISAPRISDIGMMAMTMQTSTLIAAAVLLRLPKRHSVALQRLEDDREDHRPETAP